jgi:hypothetical protein
MKFLKGVEKKLFNQEELVFIEELISEIISIDIDGKFENNFEKLKNLLKEKDAIKTTKVKLDNLIEKYNLGDLQNALKKTFDGAKINENTINKTKSMKTKSMKTKKYSSMKTKKYHPPSVVHGGSASTLATKGTGKVISTFLFANINSFGVFFGSIITFAQYILFVVLINLFVQLELDESRTWVGLARNLVIFIKRLCNLVTIIHEEDIVNTDDDSPIIQLPDDEVIHTSSTISEGSAIVNDVPNNTEHEILQNIEYFRNLRRKRRYNIRYAFRNDNISEYIRILQGDLDRLRQPRDLMLPAEFIANDLTIVADNNDNQSATHQDEIVPIRPETKNTLKFFIQYCLDNLRYNNTISGGRMKTRSNKRKTNNKNKKRIARTKRNRRNSKIA